MDNNKKFELHDEALDSVAGGRDGWAGGPSTPTQHCIRNPNYACSNCGGHEFVIVDGSEYHFSGNCMNCGTYNSNISRVDGYAEIFLQ